MTKSTVASRTQGFACPIAALPLALCAPAAFAVQLLINPGFETGSFAGWTVGGNSSSTGVAIDGAPTVGADPPFPPNFVNVRSGLFAGFALVRGISPTERIILTQTIGVVPNSSYSVGFFLCNDSAQDFGAIVSDSNLQIFINGVGLLGGPVTSVPNGSTAADFVEFASTFNSGANASVTVAFAINGAGLGRVNASFDDFRVEGPAPAATGVAEPATLALLAFGLAGLGLSRRKCGLPLARKQRPRLAVAVDQP